MNDPQTPILTRLRALCPKRGLTQHEARMVAEQQAALLLQLTGTADAPVPTQILTDLPRVVLGTDASIETSGISYWDGQDWRLLANGQEHPNRQRFSLFHEFKHVIDHPNSTLLYDTNRGREQVADHFAACALMPKIALTQAWCNGIQNVADLARRFAVSPIAMRRRLAELGLETPTEISTFFLPKRVARPSLLRHSWGDNCHRRIIMKPATLSPSRANETAQRGLVSSAAGRMSRAVIYLRVSTSEQAELTSVTKVSPSRPNVRPVVGRLKTRRHGCRRIRRPGASRQVCWPATAPDHAPAASTGPGCRLRHCAQD